MKRSNVLEIHFKNRKEFWSEAVTALRKRQPLIQPKHVIYFESVIGFRNFMTMQKVEILTTIYNCKPKTIYELAKIVDRDFPGVLRDCTSLKTTGFIDLKESKDAKRSKKPVLSFPYKSISVFLPRSPYQIAFKEVA